jgi:accessory gene regulator protein AgrB
MGILVSILCLSIYAPADTPKRPLINKKKRTIYKILTIILSFIYAIAILCIKNNIIITNTLLYSMLLESFLVAPLTYKLFGVPYKNYKNYKRKESKK